MFFISHQHSVDKANHYASQDNAIHNLMISDIHSALRSFFLFSTFVTHLSTVIATMRDLKRKDKLVEAAGDAYGKTLSLAVLDVCNDESVTQCINGIKDRHIDVLSK